MRYRDHARRIVAIRGNDPAIYLKIVFFTTLNLSEVPRLPNRRAEHHRCPDRIRQTPDIAIVEPPLVLHLVEEVEGRVSHYLGVGRQQQISLLFQPAGVTYIVVVPVCDQAAFRSLYRGVSEFANCWVPLAVNETHPRDVFYRHTRAAGIVDDEFLVVPCLSLETTNCFLEEIWPVRCQTDRRYEWLVHVFYGS